MGDGSAPEPEKVAEVGSLEDIMAGRKSWLRRDLDFRWCHSVTSIIFMATVAAIVEHLTSNLREQHKPLFVALQGPQGSGKSYLAALLKAQLSAPPHTLNVAIFSIDDLYLPHAGLVKLAEQHPENSLWKGRGQPGTHDVDLGLHVLRALRSQSEPVELPRFDKSLFDGEGDRLPLGLEGTNMIQPSLDVVIFEGWCVGFHPISQAELDLRWNGIWQEEKERLNLTISPRKMDLEAVNEVLKSYLELWSLFDTFVQVCNHLFPLVSLNERGHTDQTQPFPKVCIPLFHHISMAPRTGAFHEGFQWRSWHV